MARQKCDELFRYKHEVLDKKYPLLGMLHRTVASPRAKDFFKLRAGAKHAPRLTHGSRSIPSNVPSYISELRDNDYVEHFKTKKRRQQKSQI